MADTDLTSYLPMYTDPRLQAPAAGAQPLYAAGNIPLRNTGGATGAWQAPPSVMDAAKPTSVLAPPSVAPQPNTVTPPVPDAATNVANYVKVVKALGPSRLGRGAGTGAAMPKTAAAPVVPNQPAAPVVPGETGFQMGNNGPVVPYGTMFDASGDGSFRQVGGAGGGGGLYDGLPGGGKMVNGRFADPRDALEVGFRLQSQYRDESMQRILALAGNGGDLGYRARVGALAQAFGQNNFGATSVGGANALNNAIAGVTSSGINAGASMYGSEAALTGHLASVGEMGREFDVSPKQIGGEPIIGPGGVPMGVMPTFGVGNGTSNYKPLSTTRPQAAPKEGATGTYGGKKVVYKSGNWTYAE